MTIKSGFFNSVASDRVYDAEDFNTLLGGIITDGVFQNIGDALVVSDGNGMQVSVGTGRAWYLDTWLDNDAGHILQLSVSNAGFDRIDIIALDFNVHADTRENSIVIVEGTAAASPVAPALANTSTHKQYPLAHVLVPASSTELTQSNITNKVGTVDTPFITSVLQSVQISNLLLQWEADFDTWFANVQAQLTGNVATNLQAQIDVHSNEIDAVEASVVTLTNTVANLPDPIPSIVGRNILNNGAMSVMQRGAWAGDVVALAGYRPGIPDRWKIVANMNGNFRVNRLNRAGLVGKWMEFQCISTSAQGWNNGSGYLIIEQTIEGYRTAGVGFGTADEKDLTLSFKTFGNYIGTYYVQVYDGSASHYYPFTTTVATEEHHTIALTKGVFGHDHGNGAGLKVRVWIGSGNARFTSGDRVRTFMGIAGNKLAITDVQLEIGESASHFDRRSYEDDLLECQRYYEVYDRDVLLHNNSFQPTPSLFACFTDPGDFKTPKRAVPALSNIAIFAGRNVNGTPITAFNTAEELEYTSTTTYRTKTQFRPGVFRGVLNLTINPDWTQTMTGVLQLEADAEL